MVGIGGRAKGWVKASFGVRGGHPSGTSAPMATDGSWRRTLTKKDPACHLELVESDAIKAASMRWVLHIDPAVLLECLGASWNRACEEGGLSWGNTHPL